MIIIVLLRAWVSLRWLFCTVKLTKEPPKQRVKYGKHHKVKIQRKVSNPWKQQEGALTPEGRYLDCLRKSLIVRRCFVSPFKSNSLFEQRFWLCSSLIFSVALRWALNKGVTWCCLCFKWLPCYVKLSAVNITLFANDSHFVASTRTIQQKVQYIYIYV